MNDTPEASLSWLSQWEADASGHMPHYGNLLHRTFLYHMALNGVEVVACLK
ncbi:MAG: hypothetical protein U5R49_00675 [Deltaproteobacteria bacterium]|nr:hypothetical protein [Deltaproteobacteria bacterium]